MTVERSDIGAGDSFGAAINALERIEHGFATQDGEQDPDVPDGATTEEIRAQAVLHHGDRWLEQLNGSNPKWCEKALEEARELGLVTLEGDRWRLG